MWKPTLLAAVLVCAPFGANAAWISFTSVREGGCKTEFHRYCAHARPGNGRIQSCLREHRAVLSKACLRALKRYRNSRNFHLKMRRHARRDPYSAVKPHHPPSAPKHRAPGK